MKRKVFAYVYVVPILLLLIFFIRAQVGSTRFQLVTSFLFLAIFFLALLTDRRYLQHYIINEDGVVLTYMNQFFQVKTVERTRSELTYLQLSKRSWYSVISPPELHLKTEEEYKGFYIISRQIYQGLQAELPGNKLGTVNA